MKVIVRLQPSLRTQPKNVSDVSALVSISPGLTVSVALEKLLMCDHTDAACCVTSLRAPTNPL